MNNYANDWITTRSDVCITGWGCGQDTVYLTINGEQYTLSKRRGLVGSGGPTAVKNAFREDGEHGVEIITGLREMAESETFRHWRDELLEQIDILEKMMTDE